MSKKTIRKGCFETNSSSMHSIVVTKLNGNSPVGDYWKCFNPDDNRDIDPWYSLEFGWGFKCLSTIRDKAKFAVASFAEDEDVVNEILEIYEKVTGYKVKLPMDASEKYIDDKGKEYYWFDISCVDDKPVLKEELNNPNVTKYTKITYTQTDVIDANIDHQSVGLLKGFLKENNVSLEDFITKARYIVIIDNDNEHMFDGILTSGVWDLEKVECRYPLTGSYDCYLYENKNKDKDNNLD